uniref:Nebulin n=1 Tax=Chrysolophus pictus TaxID=9089 RepID=A0A8C3M2I4_CHRPC
STEFTGPTTITRTIEYEKTSGEDAPTPVRKKTIRTKVDSSKFLTPYLQHSNKMKDLFSENKYKEKFNKERGKPYASTIDTPEIRRIKKVQDQLSEVKYRMAGEVARTICHVDEKAWDIEHAKKVSQQVSKVLYKQNWEENKDKYLLPPDAPELVNAIKNTAMFSKKLYTEDWEGDKTLFYPYNDSPELRRVAQAQKALSDIVYKKGHDERKSKYTSLPDPPDVEQAKKVTRQLSDIIYHEDYKNKIKGKWSQTPCYDVAIAKMNAENISMKKYQEDFENVKDQIYFMQTETPEYEANKRVSENVSKIKYRADYEKNKAIADYNVLPATENPLLRQLKTAGDVLSDKLYKEAYEQSKGTSMNYCDTPKFQTDSVLKNFSDVKYKDAYQKNILGHYLGSFEDPHQIHCMKVEAMKSDKNYKADYEEDKTKCYFPQTITQEYEAIKKLEQCKDHTYKKHPDQIKFTQVTDSPVQKQAEINSKQLSDVSEHTKHTWTKTLMWPVPYKYKEAYEKAKGKQVGFKSLQDDPKLVHYMHVAKIQSDREYKKDYEKSKTNYHTPPDTFILWDNLGSYFSVLQNVYKQDYNSWFKGIGWSPLGSLDVEKAKKAGDALNEKRYRQHPDTIKFTSVPDSMTMVLAQHNTKQLSDVSNSYKQEGEKVKHKYKLDPDVPQFIQARVNAFNLSDVTDWKKTIAKGYDLKPDAIPIIAAKASRNIASDYKYKESYEKDKGKQVGFRSLQDDPKLVHYMRVAKIQSEREYKKDYEVTKTKYHTPLDMFSVTAAKKAQEAVTNTGYKQPIHHYTLLPDSVNLELSRNMMQLQSDNVYKADFNNWLRGVGWLPIQSLDVEKAKKASDILSEKKYRQHPDKLKYSIPLDAMEQVLAKQNAKTMNKVRTCSDDHKKTSIHVMPDTPEILQSRVNQITMSNKLYKAGWEEDKKKGYDMRPDAIPIKAAKTSQDIASDYKYKLAYEKAKGKHIGFRSLEDDPKLVHFMQVAKMQSDREYKKDYEKAKTNFHTPVDMLSVVAAKKAQEVATNANYKNLIHIYNVLPDAMSLELAKNMMQIQSNNQYRADYDESMKGVGWMPLGSLEAEKNKKAMEILSEKKYRQHPDKLKYSVPVDSMNMALALHNAKIMDEHQYKQAWEEDKKKVHMTPDIPQFALAKANAFNISDVSTYKYKLGYEQDKGKLVGFRSLQDDPKLVHYMQVAKMQSDREYKKAYEASKTHYQTPSDALSIMAAKEAQDRVTNANYKRLIHHYMLLPDAMSFELCRNMNQIQSNNEYKQDYNEWFKGIGWSPVGSLDVEKSKKATEIASDRKYRQHPSTFSFTKQIDAMDMVLAKHNADIMNKAWEKDKTQVHVMPDTPDILQAKQNKANYSQKQYKLDWEEMIKKGYDLTPEAISVKAAKASRDIASDYKYKEGYRKQQGHHIGFRSLQDDPKMMWSMQVAKMQSEREYKKDFEKWKTKFNMPVDMLGFLLAKKCQELVSDIDYKHMLHRWTCLPDQNDVTQAKRVYDLQSDNLYKSDLQWLRGIGWSPLGSLESEKNKKASEILSEKKYRQHPDTIKFTSIPDAMNIILAKSNAKNRSDILYREAWDKDKTQVHIMPDTPEILLAKSNLINTSDKHYKLGYEELRRKGYDLPPDAIPLKAAKASRDIASEYQYKTAYRKQLGHHIGARNIEDDPKMMWSMHVAKIQSDREYKKAFEKTKTHFSSPVDMLGIVLAKKCQELVSDIDYKHLLHRWTCLPDQNDVVQARKVYDLQSDNVYKSDLQWLKGIGWSPIGSLDEEKNKRASMILSDKKYRQHPDTIKFTSLPDSMPMVLAKHNSKIMDHRSYIAAWEKDKTSVHIMPDTPGILLAQQNKVNYSEKMYRLAMEEDKKKGYDLRADAIPIKSAKASRDIASDYKYKEGYRKQLGHHIGARNIEDDPKMMWSMHVAKIQSDREYKKVVRSCSVDLHVPPAVQCRPGEGEVYIPLCGNNVYKSDLQWLKGIGWSPIGSLDEEKNKRASMILSDKKYRQHPDTIKFTSLPDSMPMVLAKHNSKIMDHRSYIAAWEKDKTSVHIMPDTPGILLAQQNKVNYSEKMYRLAMEEDKKKGYDLRADAIPIKSAKASRDIASDYKYKEGYRKQLGHHIGARNIEDDPKMMWSMHVAKIQSDREYKKAFEKTKTHFSSPVDMLGIVLAKKCQELVSDIDYKHLLHRWTCLPDQNDVVQARKVYDLQSDNVYKSDLQWLKGIGWSPIGSLDEEKNKRASMILSDKKYRQHPDTIKFTSLPDSMPMVLAKHNSEIMNHRSYIAAWEKDKTSVHIMPDTPGILLAQQNKVNYSEKMYRLAMEEDKKKGYDLRADAIPIKSAKASRDIASDYKYKEGYRKQLGHHIGARNIEDDPKMMWSMHVAKIQSDREYKKAFEKTKTHFSSPVDMLGIVLAKKCQELVSDVDYRHYLHQWICLPDQNDVIHARKAYDLQSDNFYKSDLEWMRGIGWVPIGSLDIEKAKRAGQILSDKVYRQPPDTIKFTSVTDSLEMNLAKHNAEVMNKRLYTEAWDKDKTQIHIMPDTPEITLAKQNMHNYSEKLYKQAMEEAKKKGYDLRSDAIPIQAAKASRQIASDYKYKEGYRKQLGHHIGARNIEDDPKMMWSMHVAKIQSDREYKKAFEKTKTHFSSPVDMLGIVLAKKCQELVSDVDYRHYLHQWICLPDQNDVIHARKAYDLQSDNFYKSDLEWMRGIGWVPIGSLDIEKAKRAGQILSDKVYRQPPDTIKFTSVTDSLEMNLAKHNAEVMNKRLYTEAWNKDKTTIHVMPDTPEIMLAKQNQAHYSQKMYRLALEESKKKGHDLRFDAIPIQAAKASREIASDYKYKEGYRKQLGHHIGARNIEDDPKMMWSMHVAKIQSDREYKKAFEKTKTHFSSPVDMLGIVLAKKCQELVSDVDYRHHLHQWICLPDQNDVIHARKAYDLQSDAVYKSDLEWLKGIGWVPIGSLDVEKAKKAGEILSERKYRQPADQIKFTSVTDSLAMMLAKHNAEIMNKRLYTEAWDADKTSIHVMPDTPTILLAKANAANVSHKHYIQAWEDAKKKGYDMRADAIPIRSAKASRDIASDYKYKEAHEKQKGHYIGCRTAKEDPKLSWAARAMLLQNDRIYRKAYNDSKAQIHIPVDAMSVQAAKECQTLVSDVDYRHYLHQWTCLPDHNDVVHARKAYDLQSDNVYKSDLEWLRGIGWLTEGSVDVVKAKKAQEILSDRLYRTLPDQIKFTSITDSPDVVQAKINAMQLSNHLYREVWDKDKTQISIPSDTPEMLQSKLNALNISNKHYQKAWDEAKAKNYDLRADAIPIKHAKASRDIASEYKYKEAHEKQKGHYIGCRTAKEDPKLSWAARAMLLQNDRIYRKAYNDSKAPIHLPVAVPVDAMSVQAAKECQTLVSDVDYRHYLHQWTCLPDHNDVVHARKAYDLQSDNVYKSDLEWLRGIGWLTEGSVDVVKAKKAQEILNDKLYRTRPDQIKFTSVTDAPDVVQAKINAMQLSNHLYREAWDKDKTQISIPSDTPEMLQSKLNALNISNKHYQKAWDEAKAKNYDLRADAIPIKHAKASRDIASEYKYKEAHEKQKGHYIGCRTAKEDPKLSWAARAMLLQNDRIYRKAYNDSKAQIHIPVDAMSVQAAKECQTLVSDVDYRHYLHQWTCLPDHNDVVHARKAYDLQSDAVYKSDLEWLRGIGWLPNDSPGIQRVKHAQDLLSDKVYRTPIDSVKYTSVVDSPDIVLAKVNAEQLSIPKYKEAWEKDKTMIHIMPDTPEINLARSNAHNYSKKLYREAWDEVKMSYDLRADAIPIKAAKASREIASDYKYKLDHEKQKGHYVGVPNAKADTKMQFALGIGKVQSELEYKKHFAKWKTQCHLPVDMLSIQSAKHGQSLVSDVDYRHYLHQWICLPDQNDVIHARKAYDLQSDAVYKSDLEWLRGIGWLPNDSLGINHVKHAGDLLNERKYRTKVETLQFTPVTDRVDYVTAKKSGEILSDIKYHKAWNEVKSNYTLTDTPQLDMAREAARILNQSLYKESWEKEKATGYLLPPDTVQIRHAKHSNDVQSELKYKADYVKQRGHYVGVPSMRDDPKLVWFEHAGEIQNDRLYKSNYHKTKSKIHIPADIMSVVAAKECQTLVSDVDYRHYLHQWTCHPDQNDCIQARKAYDLQSDNIYKSDLEWLRGCGWIPLDSVEHKKVKKYFISLQRAYTKDALENFSKFTSVVDTPDIVLAKINSVNQSDLKYKETFNLEKGQYIGSDDTPELNHARDMSLLYSDKLYKRDWEISKPIGYTLDTTYIPLVGAKHANYVNSERKYKELYEKLKGHYLAGKDIGDFPSVVHSLAFQKIRSALAYRKNYEDTKTRVHIPSDMMNHVLAKKCQYILSDLEYRTYLHHWNCSPEEHDVIQARRAQEILSDVVYKDDLNWLKGIGCYVWDTPQILHAKKSYDLQSQIKYTAAGKENLQNFGVVTDTPVYVTAVQSTINASDVKYKEDYHKTKDKYTTVTETADSERVQNLKHLFSNNLYKEAWDRVKATSYIMPSDAVSLARAKELKHNASIVKYREEYDKFKALYTLPRSVEDDPNTARCLRVGKLNIDRLYKETYEKNKAKVHIVPDMVDIIAAKDAQQKISEIDYRTRLHDWICLPDLQINAHVRKVADQISDVVYKDDLNWLKGIGCFVWDTPEILHAKHAYDLRSDIKYKSDAEKTKSKYTVVMDTPVYVQSILSGLNASEVVYRGDYLNKVRGKMIPTNKTVDLERAHHANKIQSEVTLPTGYSLPKDTPGFQHAKHVQYIGSDLKYKEAYEHMKAKGYTLGPNDVGFENVKKVNQVINERLYRATYHKNKDKIHTTPDTPEIRQVKATQEAVSDLIYKSDFFKMQGHLISLPFTPQVLHCRYVGDITSDNKYKEDLKWLQGLGCFLYDTPDMVRARQLRKLWSNYVYTDTAKKMRDKYSVVLDTPGYRTVQELKTHLSDLVYRAAGKELKTKYTSVLDTPDFLRAKKGQKIQSQYLYVELATKERPHHHAGSQTPAFTHARHVKDMVSETKYKIQYEKMKDKYTPVLDTPVLIRAKRAYLNASDLRYKETFENTKGKYHTVKDALDIVYHRKVTDDISSVKYKENYMSQLGVWRSIPDRPEHFHHRIVTDAISDVKYKEDLSWLRGIGCYAWDTPDFTLAGKNKVLYSGHKYKEMFEKTKSHFQYVADSPINRHFKHATQLLDAVSVEYKKDYEKKKDKYTTVVDTPENLRTAKVNKQISDIIYKLEYNKAKPKGYTTIHDTPMLLHVRKVKDRISDLKYKEVYERNKSHCNVVADSVHIKTPRHAYKLNSNLDYKKKYEAAKAHWHWIADRPDFVQAAKSSLQQSDYEYKLDREFLKGCKLSVTDDKNTVLALNNAILASDIKYKEKHNKARGTCLVVPDTPQILLAKNVSSLVSENKYKEHSKKQLPRGSYTTLPETRDTAHVKEVTKNVSDTNYKKKFVKEKGKSNYSIMLEPPEVKHAMEVAKKQSTIEYKKDAKTKLHYTPIADRPDIKKATQAAKLISDIEYKKRGEAGLGVTMLGRPDIELAKEVSKLTSQVKYKENFSKEKGKKPKYDLKEAKIYKTMKDAHNIASEVKYKADLKKLHKPVTDMSESLIMNHVLNTSQLASAYQYKKQYEKSKGHYHMVPDNLEQVHLREASELQSHVKYKEKYEKEKGKPMLDFETPTYLTAKESQLMQSEKEYKRDFEESIKGRNLTGLEITPSLLHVKYATKIASEKEYRKDLEEGVKGKGLSVLEETPDMLRAKNATQILNEKEYKKALELEIRGKGLSELALETPDFVRAKNATDIASQIKYKQLAEMEKANYTSVVDTPEIIHAQQVKNLSSQKKYKEEAERTMPYYVPVADTPEMQRVRENQKNFSTLQYQWDLQNSKGKVTVVQDTPEMLRVKENQKNFSSILYKEDIGTGTTIEKTPEMQRVKRTQDAISSIKYKESIGKGTPIPDLPEVKRVKETQKHISSVLYKEEVGTGIPTPVTPEIERVRRNQEHISSVSYKEGLGMGIPTPVTPEMERVKRNQENISFTVLNFFSSLSFSLSLPHPPPFLFFFLTNTPQTKPNKPYLPVLYKENIGKATPTPVTPEMERVKRNQEIISSVLYKENVGKVTPTPITPEMERVRRNQEIISSVPYKEIFFPLCVYSNVNQVLYKEQLAKGTPTPMTPEMERAKRNQENISSVLYSDSFRKQVQGKAAYVLDTPEMRRVRETQKHISTVKYHEDFEKNKGTFTPVVTDPITERVKKNMHDFSDISYRGIQRRVVEMEQKRVDQDQENLTGLRVWRTNPGSVFDYDPAEDNIQSRSLHMITVQAQRRSREHSRSASALSISGGDEKSEPSEGVNQHMSYYSNEDILLPLVVLLSTKTYRAMYDYTAADADEVSFKDGDTIVNVQAIDEGWMYGTVQRTGKTGMLPANYVEAV